MGLSVEGLLETSLYVADLDQSLEFYTRIFSFRPIHRESDRLQALSISDRQVLLLFRIGASKQATETEHGRIPPHNGQGNLHLAFAISAEQLQPWRDLLVKNGVTIESEVHCGGHSLYFRDPDGHLIELITPGCWSVY